MVNACVRDSPDHAKQAGSFALQLHFSVLMPQCIPFREPCPDSTPYSGISFAVRLSQTHSADGFSSSVVLLLTDLLKLIICCVLAILRSTSWRGIIPQNLPSTFPAIVPAVLVREACQLLLSANTTQLTLPPVHVADPASRFRCQRS